MCDFKIDILTIVCTILGACISFILYKYLIIKNCKKYLNIKLKKLIRNENNLSISELEYFDHNFKLLNSAYEQLYYELIKLKSKEDKWSIDFSKKLQYIENERFLLNMFIDGIKSIKKSEEDKERIEWTFNLEFDDINQVVFKSTDIDIQNKYTRFRSIFTNKN